MCETVCEESVSDNFSVMRALAFRIINRLAGRLDHEIHLRFAKRYAGLIDNDRVGVGIEQFVRNFVQFFQTGDGLPDTANVGVSRDI
jgi:hypothetical protein